jgi:hypothetical protein
MFFAVLAPPRNLPNRNHHPMKIFWTGMIPSTWNPFQCHCARVDGSPKTGQRRNIQRRFRKILSQALYDYHRAYEKTKKILVRVRQQPVGHCCLRTTILTNLAVSSRPTYRTIIASEQRVRIAITIYPSTILSLIPATPPSCLRVLRL